jgi:acyl transferase domain-containing protein
MPEFDRFDAEFFGFSGRDATLLDPQHRILLECAWEALEHAGVDPGACPERIGCFAGATLNTYLLTNIVRRPELFEALDPAQINVLAGGDFLATRVSYKLNLRGPSFTVQSACSTSLLAVHLACQSLLDHECDAALAGGVSVNVKLLNGYRYVEGGILSPDGHCRPFDAGARGTVFGSGAGVVVLKRLAEAVVDGDTVHAVVLGSAVNNDGSVKVSYTAPSVGGQVAVITEALAAAGVGAETVGYVEAHGTGTALGDPIEVRALREAFAGTTAPKSRCGLGSVKGNIGHLDAAAGVAGLIKTVLMLAHGELVPSLHFQRANPALELEHTPFYVVTQRTPWVRGMAPRRAGVSAFGVGGTNVHVVLEEAPAMAPPAAGRPSQLLVMSARSSTALARQTAALAAVLEDEAVPLADVAYTLAVGRRAFRERAMVVGATPVAIAAALGGAELERATVEVTERPLALLVGGEGGADGGLGAALYASEPAFRAQIDAGARVLQSRLGLDVRTVLYPSVAQREWAAAQLVRPAVAQPALFVTLAAWVTLWEAWGVTAQAVVGHSLGEYVAAWAAGVWTFDEALALLVQCGALAEALAPSALLEVSLDEAAVRARVAPPLEVAAINGPAVTVVGGPAAAVGQLERALQQTGVGCQRLITVPAFHTAQIAPMQTAWAAAVAAVPPRRPQRPFVSNVTGTWITDAEAQAPAYWAEQLRAPVQFARVLATLGDDPHRVLIEVGAGTRLTQLARQAGCTALASSAEASTPDGLPTLLTTLGRLWLAGVDVDWSRFYHGQTRRRVPLPTYSFDRQRHWIDALPAAAPPPSIPVGGLATTPKVIRHPRPDLKTPYASPRDEFERRIVRLWEETLGVDRVGVNDNFFDLGGNSLIALELIAALKRELGFDVSVAAMYEVLTVRALVALIAPQRIGVVANRGRARRQSAVQAQAVERSAMTDIEPDQ